MADLHKTFEQFNRDIRLDPERRKNLIEKRKELESILKSNLDPDRAVWLNDLEIEFQTQGSIVMDTIINPQGRHDEYDLDYGVYFLGSSLHNFARVPKEVHDEVFNALTTGYKTKPQFSVQKKRTCIRVAYRGDHGDFNYHIDLPLYRAKEAGNPELADLSKGWILSQPIKFIVWFEKLVQSGFRADYILESRLYADKYDAWLNDRRKKDHQLRRIVRYLKTWAAHQGDHMPPGVALTILAGSNSNYVANSRDDLSLRDTLVNIQKWLQINGFKCPRPTTPVNEDLFESYTTQRKQMIESSLADFIADANTAIANPNPYQACKLWQRHLGKSFKCSNLQDRNVVTPSLASIASQSNLWAND